MADPLALNLSWLTRADNCIVTDKLKVKRAKGFTSQIVATSITGAYATDDFSRLYLVDDGSLVQIHPDFSRRTLATGLSSAPFRFTEVNGVVYATNGASYFAIDNQGARQWGIAPPAAVGSLGIVSGSLPAGLYRVTCTLTDSRGLESGNGDISAIIVADGSGISIAGIPERTGYSTTVYVTGPNDETFYALQENASGALIYNHGPDALGDELKCLFANQPHGVLPAFYGGRMYLADPYPTLDASLIWRSFPLQYHLFDDGSEGTAVPGRVLMLAACDGGLIIGTERAVYSQDEDGAITMLAPYGVVPGDHASRHRGHLYFWTVRGLCRALPFENLTESTISVAPGLSACGKVLEQDGFRRYMVALNAGGDAYNANTALQPADQQDADLLPRTRRHDWEDPYDYMSVAPVGSSEVAAAWRITRLTVNGEGDVTAVQMAHNVRWTDRATATYT